MIADEHTSLTLHIHTHKAMKTCHPSWLLCVSFRRHKCHLKINISILKDFCVQVMVRSFTVEYGNKMNNLKSMLINVIDALFRSAKSCGKCGCESRWCWWVFKYAAFFVCCLWHVLSNIHYDDDTYDGFLSFFPQWLCGVKLSRLIELLSCIIYRDN